MYLYFRFYTERVPTPGVPPVSGPGQGGLGGRRRGSRFRFGEGRQRVPPYPKLFRSPFGSSLVGDLTSLRPPYRTDLKSDKGRCQKGTLVVS